MASRGEGQAGALVGWAEVGHGNDRRLPVVTLAGEGTRVALSMIVDAPQRRSGMGPPHRLSVRAHQGGHPRRGCGLVAEDFR